ncbi:MAG: ABC1 kinase family protein [Chthoniobacterales bacterium]
MLKQFRSAVSFAMHLPRHREILSLLFKYGFADVLQLVVLQNLLGFHDAQLKQHDIGILSKPLPERLRLVIEELGPTFIKFGQIVSSRRDLVSDDYYHELCKLQDHVPPFPIKEVHRIIKASLGKSVKSLFRSFDPVPCGAASIGQVHEAVLHNGTQVAVKVQRPNIREVIHQDLEILIDLAAFLEKHVPELSGLNPEKVVEEFSVALMKELNFTNEASNAERFAKQFEGDETVFVPAIYRELSSTNVLTMDFIKGWKINEPKLLAKQGISPSELGVTVCKLIFQQIFTFGFFHADPHPGNMVVLPYGVIGLYDYGMMGSFSPEFRRSIAKMITGLAKKNHQQFMQAILEMSEEGFVQDSARFLYQVEEFSDQNLAGSLRDIKFGEVLNKLLELLRVNHLRMKGSFYLGIKALTQVEAIGQQLDPSIDFIEIGKPYAARFMAESYQPRRLLKVGLRLVTETIDLLEELPHDIRLLYSQLKHGKLSIPLEHRIAPEGIEPLRKTLDSVFNRLVNAILAASMLVASSILIHSGLPPKVFGIPLIGLLGLCFGFYMCLRLAFSIWKHGGL